MDNFVSESSIGGVVVFHSSEPKKARIGWIFAYFIFFILLGFYIFNIHTRYQVEPEFTYKFSQFPLQEIPFPAVTICHPLFARNQSVNLREFLKNPVTNLTVEQQNLFAANVQACDPQLGKKMDEFCPLADSQKIVEILKSKFIKVDDAFSKTGRGIHGGCTYNWAIAECSRLLNYVLTDFGYCFSFNLEGFPTLFNTEIISDDFKCYKRDQKIASNYYYMHPNYGKYINETSQSIHWNLMKGFLTNLSETLPVRAFYNKGNSFHSDIKVSDLGNLCPKIGNGFLMFFHMPNEILTPFHQPNFVRKSNGFDLKAKLYKVDENLRPYSPKKRNCYFEEERKLKFFKSYTKAHCQFECLANFTLKQCGCVKFSMPRENSTRICGLKDTSCYIQVAKNWNLTCDCLHPCTYIEYGIDQIFISPTTSFRPLKIDIKNNFQKIFGEMVEISGVYSLFQGFADFGGMLGTLFGASLISLIEIIFFFAFGVFKRKYNIPDRDENAQVSEFASSSTVHGVQYIFNTSRHKFVRFFWIFAFIFALLCCIYNSRDSYWKLNVVPETESTTNLKSIKEIPFPAIVIWSPNFASEHLTADLYPFHQRFTKDEKTYISLLNSTQYYYFIANLYHNVPNLVDTYISARMKFVENITNNFRNHRSEVDLYPYLFRSHLEVDEYLFDCKFKGKPYKCSKLFKKVMTIRGICYVFNLQSYRNLFKKEISKNFDSYGKFEDSREDQWSLDQGYFSNSTEQYPARASEHDTLELFLKFKLFLQNQIIPNYNVILPTEILTQYHAIQGLPLSSERVSIILSTKSIHMDEGLRKFLPENRGCYFEDERKLQYFKSYTRLNCFLECFTNYTMKSCGCTAYFLPHNDEMKICDSSNEAKCYYKSLISFPPANDNLNPCGCLSTCNNIEYSRKEQEKNPTKKKAKRKYISSHLKFKFDGMSNILVEEIHVAFGLREFLTNVGGFLGLYLGCSMISVIEVFYFLATFLHKKLFKKLNRISPNSDD